MVEYANEVRRLFMGEAENSYRGNSIEVTFSTRSLLRWADLILRYQPLRSRASSRWRMLLTGRWAFAPAKKLKRFSTNWRNASSRNRAESGGVSKGSSAVQDDAAYAGIPPIN